MVDIQITPTGFEFVFHKLGLFFLVSCTSSSAGWCLVCFVAVLVDVDAHRIAPSLLSASLGQNRPCKANTKNTKFFSLVLYVAEPVPQEDAQTLKMSAGADRARYKWQLRLQDSHMEESRGSWERRKDSGGSVFYCCKDEFVQEPFRYAKKRPKQQHS